MTRKVRFCQRALPTSRSAAARGMEIWSTFCRNGQSSFRLEILGLYFEHHIGILRGIKGKAHNLKMSSERSPVKSYQDPKEESFLQASLIRGELLILGVWLKVFFCMHSQHVRSHQDHGSHKNQISPSRSFFRIAGGSPKGMIVY